MIFVDTALVVDYIRGYQPARIWFAEHKDVAASRAVRLEIGQGFRNKLEQEDALKFFKTLIIVELETNDGRWASEQLTRYFLSHNIGAFDCLIAAPAFRLQAPLYTRNLKHFRPMLGALAIEPY